MLKTKLKQGLRNPKLNIEENRIKHDKIGLCILQGSFLYFFHARGGERGAENKEII